MKVLLVVTGLLVTFLPGCVLTPCEGYITQVAWTESGSRLAEYINASQYLPVQKEYFFIYVREGPNGTVLGTFNFSPLYEHGNANVAMYENATPADFQNHWPPFTKKADVLDFVRDGFASKGLPMPSLHESTAIIGKRQSQEVPQTCAQSWGDVAIAPPTTFQSSL